MHVVVRIALLLAAASMLCANTDDTVPQLGTSEEFREGSKLADGAMFQLYGAARSSNPQEKARFNARAQEDLRQAYAKLTVACDRRSDVIACTWMAKHKNLIELLPAPGGQAREAYAEKAARMFRVLCTPTDDTACFSYARFVSDLAEGESKISAPLKLRTLAKLQADLGATLAPLCFNRTYSCTAAREVFMLGSPEALRAFDRQACDSGHDPSCTAIGEKTSYERKTDLRAAAETGGCDAGNSASCLTAAMLLWSNQDNRAANAQEAARLAGRGCDGDVGLACYLAGSIRVDAVAGPDYPGAAAAFGKACNLLPAGGREQESACAIERRIRDALAAAGRPLP